MDMDPIIQWVGGKRRQLPKLLAAVDGFGAFNDYHEPFAGGLALFFALGNRITGGSIGDANGDLICLYGQVRDHPWDVVYALEAHEKRHRGKAYYHKVRDRFNELDGDKIWYMGADKAAAFLYLVNMGYNGLCRYNGKGHFNVSYGTRREFTFDRDRIFAASEQLKDIFIHGWDDWWDPENSLERNPHESNGRWEYLKPKPGDLVYLDPPYAGAFNSYTKMIFDDYEQLRLAIRARQWVEQGVKVIVSNSNTPEVRKLFEEGFDFHQFNAAQQISRTNEGRRPRREMLMVSRTGCGKLPPVETAEFGRLF